MSTMQHGDYVVYTIAVKTIVPTNRKTVSAALVRAGIPSAHQQQPDDTRIEVPRLTTFWRGDKDEHDWQRGLREAIQKANGNSIPAAKVSIHAALWEPLEGYPRGAL
jgi:hypothetical protein